MNFIAALSGLLFFYNLLLTDIGSYPWVILELNCSRNVKSSMSSPALDHKIVTINALVQYMGSGMSTYVI